MTIYPNQSAWAKLGAWQSNEAPSRPAPRTNFATKLNPHLPRALRGAEGGAAEFPFAEGFVQHRGEGHPQDNILKHLLGETCREL